MNEHVSGVHVPEPLIKEINAAKDRKKTSVAVASRLIKALKPMCQGVHIMPIGWYSVMPLVLDNIS